MDTATAGYWKCLTETPTLLQYHIRDVSENYWEAFREFFIAKPISIHERQSRKRVRLCPIMNIVITEEKGLRTEVFDANSISHRKEISAYLRRQKWKSIFCAKCEDTVDFETEICKFCVV